MQTQEDAPFGSWQSPITSKAITTGSVGIGNLMVQKDGTLLWMELRPKEGGRNVICRYTTNDEEEGKSERNAIDVTPQGTNVRTRVHEYGGGAVTLGHDDTLFYSEFTTQHLMKFSPQEKGEPIALTSGPNNVFRFADGVQYGDHLYMVREDHTKPEPKNVVNEIVSVHTTTGEVQVLATGRDFYAAPRLSPDGTKLAYISWNHPNMPWDSTELRVLHLKNADDDDKNTDSHELMSNDNGDTSVMQPLWHPQTGELYYLSDETGYYNLFKAGAKDPVLAMDKDWGGHSPSWRLGSQGFQFLKDGRLMATYGKDGKSVLLVANLTEDGTAVTNVKEYGMDDGLPMMIGQIAPSSSSDDDDDQLLYLTGGDCSSPGGVFSWSLKDRGPAKKLCSSSNLDIPSGFISTPELIEFPCPLGTAFGFYYPPTNANFCCTTEEAPPLLVKAHGGPTASTTTSFNAGIQYWTSRGFAVLDVDYGGSADYGRDYRRRLRGKWGIVDIDDVCAGANHLVESKRADPKRLCIDGGSAGGYTTLGALAFRNVFSAGCSLYGVASLEALAGDTHKFESRYLDGLVGGEYPKDRQIYVDRAPIEHLDGFNCPILLLQGEEDKIVPPNQAVMMHKAVLEKGIPCALKIYEGEQHGFRKAENIEDALDSELYFYSRVFGFRAHGIDGFEIDNLKQES